MSMFEICLDEHKERFNKPRALLVREEKTLRRYVLSWNPQLVRRFIEPHGDASLADLWDCVDVNHQALAELTGDSMPDVMATLRRLQALELIYPDGTLPVAVVRLLNAEFQRCSEEPD
ncbi:hypothetical protein [Hydrogenophaga sp.]|uniref:hypothetical protein n=1 Tax=Hydrogenophaga sp. TaxID=1904254 RepID=UPI003D0B4859